MKNSTRSEKLKTTCAVALICLMLAAVIVPFTLLAAQSVWLSAGGSLSYAPDDPLVDPVPPSTPDALKTQETALEASGFNVETTKDGLTVLGVYPGGGNEDIHDNLIANGILSYAKYENALCNYLNQLIIILDLSKYHVTRFQEYVFQGLTYAIMGGAYDFPSYTKKDEIPVYDSKTGKETKKISATFSGETVFVDGDKVGQDGLSLRIVLPNLGKDKNIVFDPYSLNFATWGSNGDGSLAPGNISIDIGNVQITPRVNADGTLALPKKEGDPEPFTGLQIAQNVSQNNFAAGNEGSCSHIHFIARTEAQLEYAMHTSIEHSKAGTPGGEFEIYIKQTPPADIPAAEQEKSKFIFTRVYSAVRYQNNKTEIDVIDEKPEGDVIDEVAPPEPTKEDIVAVLEMAYWLRYRRGETAESVNNNYICYHVRRRADNILDPVKGTLTVGATAQEIGGASVYSVCCDHVSDGEYVGENGLLGYFGENRTYFDANGNPFDFGE